MEDAPSWEELLPQMDPDDAIKVAAMLAWNRWVDELIGQDGDGAVRA